MGSCFSNMAHLPQQVPISNDMSLLCFTESINAALKQQERTILIECDSDVLIDNMQGVATIKTDKEC